VGRVNFSERARVDFFQGGNLVLWNEGRAHHAHKVPKLSQLICRKPLSRRPPLSRYSVSRSRKIETHRLVPSWTVQTRLTRLTRSVMTSPLYVCLSVFGLERTTQIVSFLTGTHDEEKRKDLMAEGLSLSSDGAIFRVRSSVGPVEELLENLCCGTPI